MITSGPKIVTFIFGSNQQGFHGAGGAGFVMYNSYENKWRTDPIMQEAIKHGPGYKGLRAVFGQAEGYMEGTIGSSYGIVTCTQPGAKRSVTLESIYLQVGRLIKFMKDNPDKVFMLVPFGSGYAGFNNEEMLPCYRAIMSQPNYRDYPP